MFAGNALGRQFDCSWVRMTGEGGSYYYAYVCRGGGGSGTFQPGGTLSGHVIFPDGSAAFVAGLAGKVPCRKPDSRDAVSLLNTTVSGKAVDQSVNMPVTSPLPVCGDVSFIDEAIYWARENPLLAAAAGFAAYKLLLK